MEALDRVANALNGMATATRRKASRAELEAFRHEVLGLQASLFIEGQLLEGLQRSYDSTLNEIFK